MRDTLRRQVRTAAAGVTSAAEFLDRLRIDGMLVRERHIERNPGEITGYAGAAVKRRMKPTCPWRGLWRSSLGR